MTPGTDSPLDQALADAETRLAEPLLQAVFGLRLAYVGPGKGLGLLDASPVEYPVHVRLPGDDAGESPRDGMAVLDSDGETIPLLSEAFDAVVLYHALELSSDPHKLLREAERILRPSGFLLLVGYRRSSLLGVAHALGRFAPAKTMRLLASQRLRDWLKLLGLRLLSTDYGFYRYPWKGSGLRLMAWLERAGTLSRAPLGGICVMMARKDVFGMTPLTRRSRERVAAPGLLLPARAPIPNRQYKNLKKDI
ncbi:MAG: class I SAM-dependent methyltransferase [Gammaproteobacteria bacterium]|nr:MAG: class I SAM-dependent methyltransferase [Gammaproteobacteria bacterium]